MRWLALSSLLSSLLLLSFSTGRAQDKDKEKDKSKLTESPYYPLAIDTKWVYKTREVQKAGDKEMPGTLTMKVTAHEKVGDVLCARVATVDGKEPHPFEHIGVTNDGIYRYSFNSVRPAKPILLLKLPPKDGDSWKVDTKAGPDSFTGTYKVDKKEIEVQGKKTTAYAVSTDDLDAGGLKLKSTAYYVEGKGLVKQDITIGMINYTIELKEYEPGKK